jgi:hypothetical protein
MLALLRGPQRFSVILRMMGLDGQKKCFDGLTKYGTYQSKNDLKDSKEWMSNVNKPRSMSDQNRSLLLD